MTTIDERYVQLHPKSAQRFADARQLFPGGVTHIGRRFSPFPVYMDHGKGPRKWDIDGNEYIDYRTGHGSMILGQAHPAIVQAVTEQMNKGTHLSASTELEVRWAQLVKKLVPSVEKLRFTSSGTEACMMAFRIARAYTGKTKIVKFKNAFHGWADGPFVGASGDREDNGIPQAVRETMVVLPYDLAEVERTLEADDDIAAVIFQGNHVIRPEFIRGLRELTRQKGVLLIFDEVVSGFRWAKGGCQEWAEAIPDLSAMAKILAGGLPGGAIGGRADLIDLIDDKIYHPGTFNANPLSAAAGSTCLAIVDREPIVERAEAMARRLKDGLNDILGRLEVPGCAYGVSSIVHVRLGVDHECDQEFCEAGDQAMMVGYGSEVIRLLGRALINEGVWGGPTSFILSASHGEEEIDLTLERYERALKAVRAEGAI